ncbi:MAG: GAF domain-containing protein [Gammaproteobacteria bacterium]|nr:GAF domain-containing protein [Gammaproteobacteria bacterium]
MNQTVKKPDVSHTQAEDSLRSRLLVRLAGIIGLLALALLLFTVNSNLLATGLNRLLVAVILLIGGIVLAASIVRLLRPPEGMQANPPSASTVNGHGYTDRGGGPDAAMAGASSAGSIKPPSPGIFPASEKDALKILYEIVSGINTAHSLDDLLTRFLYTLKRYTQARGAAIWVEKDQQPPELAASSGIDESLLLPDRQDVRRCLYERAATEGKMWVDKTLEKCEKIAGRRFFEQDNIGLVSLPMRYRGRITGVINLFLDAGFIERINDIKPLLTGIAHHISIAIEKSHDDDENREHLIKKERTRIAHELHDSLAQSLASLRLQVRVLDETLHQGDESTTWQQLERIEHSLDEANTELRGLIANFRAPSSNRGLVEAIEQVVNQFRNETRIRTYLQKDCTPRSFSKDTEIQILRIIQEALWNIRKHSQAKTVRILLRDNQGTHCHVLIEDDGVGINKQVYGSAGEHVGLTIMRERANKIGGNLRIESEPGEGTRVVLDINKPPAGNPA